VRASIDSSLIVWIDATSATNTIQSLLNTNLVATLEKPCVLASGFERRKLQNEVDIDSQHCSKDFVGVGNKVVLFRA
jgi:hypothetical protein